MIAKLFEQRFFFIFIVLISVISLSAALISQYVFGLFPCILCLYQRVPFALAALVGIIGFWKPSKWLTALIGLLFAVETGLAFFHSGVERKFWAGFDSCGGIEGGETLSIEDLRAQIMNAPVARCDEIPWDLFGLSMANYNVLLSLGLFTYAAIVFMRSRKNGKKPH